jgi:hypothetical protein
MIRRNSIWSCEVQNFPFVSTEATSFILKNIAEQKISTIVEAIFVGSSKGLIKKLFVKQSHPATMNTFGVAS